MKRLAFKMKLLPGKEMEYEKRHNEIWPELSELLKNNGVSDYSIFLDEETLTLFGVLKVPHERALDKLPELAIMQKWWAYMQDIMETNSDNSPVSAALKEVFYMD